MDAARRRQQVQHGRGSGAFRYAAGGDTARQARGRRPLGHGLSPIGATASSPVCPPRQPDPSRNRAGNRVSAASSSTTTWDTIRRQSATQSRDGRCPPFRADGRADPEPVHTPGPGPEPTGPPRGRQELIGRHGRMAISLFLTRSDAHARRARSAHAAARDRRRRRGGREPDRGGVRARRRAARGRWPCAHRPGGRGGSAPDPAGAAAGLLARRGDRRREDGRVAVLLAGRPQRRDQRLPAGPSWFGGVDRAAAGRRPGAGRRACALLAGSRAGHDRLGRGARPSDAQRRRGRQRSAARRTRGRPDRLRQPGGGGLPARECGAGRAGALRGSCLDRLSPRPRRGGRWRRRPVAQRALRLGLRGRPCAAARRGRRSARRARPAGRLYPGRAEFDRTLLRRRAGRGPRTGHARLVPGRPRPAPGAAGQARLATPWGGHRARSRGRLPSRPGDRRLAGLAGRVQDGP